MATQKDFEELLEQLRQEEECCEGCGSRNSFTQSDECESCATHNHIREIEELIRNMEGSGNE